jgi:hypothetical protein
MYDAQTAIDCVERHFKPKSIVYKENDRIWRGITKSVYST